LFLLAHVDSPAPVALASYRNQLFYKYRPESSAAPGYSSRDGYLQDAGRSSLKNVIILRLCNRFGKRF
jgi:hypothetical protein